MVCCLILCIILYHKRKRSTRQLQQASLASTVRSLQTTVGPQQATIRPSQTTVQSYTYPSTSLHHSWNTPSSYNTRETTFTLIPTPPRPPAYNSFYDYECGTVRSINNPSISYDGNPSQAVDAQPPSYNPYYHGNNNVPAADSNNIQSNLHDHDHDPPDPPPDYDTVVSTSASY